VRVLSAGQSSYGVGAIHNDELPGPKHLHAGQSGGVYVFGWDSGGGVDGVYVLHGFEFDADAGRVSGWLSSSDDLPM
jgi:hypothetical protein